MKEILFTGVVHPVRSRVSLPKCCYDLENKEKYFVGKLHVEVSFSQVSAFLETNDDSVCLYTWLNTLKPKVEALVDSMGFLAGAALEVEIIKAYDLSSKETTVFSSHLDFLHSNLNDEDIMKKFDKLFCIPGYEGVLFHRCLADLRMAILFPFDTPMYCFRAIEAIRRIYCLVNDLDADSKRSQSWSMLRKDLGISQDMIKQNIQNAAEAVRHGGFLEFSEESRKEMLLTTWDIVNKFVDKNIR